MAKSFTLIDGELYKRTASGVLQRCIPIPQGCELLRDIHAGVCGHHAASRTLVLNENLDHAYVVAPNKIDEDRKANLIKSIFKSWPSIRLQKCPPFGTPILSQHIPTHAGSLGRVR
jgi:hypothetical protein